MNSSPTPIAISESETRALLQRFVDDSGDLRFEMDPKKHKITGIDPLHNPVCELRLPLPFPSMREYDSLEAYLIALPEELPSYMMMLVQAGAAAMGYFEEGEPVVHKAIKKYMKRHKRGKSQIKYLNTRGKSKAGSRIRLANTVRFFEEINTRLQEWEEEYAPERIIYSCTATGMGAFIPVSGPTTI